MTLSTEPSRSRRSSAGGTSNGTCAAASVFFARVIRACTVGGRRQERPGDLVAGQAADHPQRQRDAGLARQHRVAGDEHQREHVVVDPVGVPQQVVLLSGSGVAPEVAWPSSRSARQRGVPLVEGGPPPEGVDGPPPADGEQPAGRVARHAVARPGDQRLGERLLGEVLGQREVAGVAGQRADDPRRLDPPDGLDGLATRRGVARPARAAGGHSWPVGSRHARSFWIHSLSCGNSSMLGTRRISVFEPGTGQRRPLGPLDGLLLRGDVEDVEAAEQLLGLAVRARR